MKRRDRIKKRREKHRTIKETPAKPSQEKTEQKTPEKKTGSFYERNYKQLLIIPFGLLVIALILIGIQTAQTGDFINKGITLKGGTTITILDEGLNHREIRGALQAEFPLQEINTRRLEEAGRQAGITIEASILPEDREQSERLTELVKEITGKEDEDLSVETIGAALGDAFFRQTMVAVLIAFVFMGIVVFLYFKSFVPSAAVILAAFSNIVVTIAILNIAGITIGTAGIAALLMLIGYSVDTDILLSTRVLKRTQGTVYERTIDAMKTGLTMTGTTLVAVFIAFLVAESQVLMEIMMIIMIGLVIDLINTWIQNAGILRYYLERKGER